MSLAVADYVHQTVGASVAVVQGVRGGHSWRLLPVTQLPLAVLAAVGAGLRHARACVRVRVRVRVRVSQNLLCMQHY